MRTFLALTLLCGALFVSGCFGACDTCSAPPPPPGPRPAVVMKRAPVIRPAPPLPPTVCDPCAGF